jgi:hypothetical protein
MAAYRRFIGRLRKLEGGVGGTCERCGYPLQELGSFTLRVVEEGGEEVSQITMPCDHHRPYMKKGFHVRYPPRCRRRVRGGAAMAHKWLRRLRRLEFLENPGLTHNYGRDREEIDAEWNEFVGELAAGSSKSREEVEDELWAEYRQWLGDARGSGS